MGVLELVGVGLIIAAIVFLLVRAGVWNKIIQIAAIVEQYAPLLRETAEFLTETFDFLSKLLATLKQLPQLKPEEIEEKIISVENKVEIPQIKIRANSHSSL